jgi:putative ABC transport system permease protein
MQGLRELARFEWRRAWRTMIVLGVLAGVGAGAALSAAQVARRSSTAYARLERATGTPDAIILGFSHYDPQRIADLPMVESAWMVQTGIGRLDGDAVAFLGMFGAPEPPPPGLFTPILVEGRHLDPRADDELIITDNLAEASGLRVGDEGTLSFLKEEEVAQFDSGFGEPDGPKIHMRVVGIVRAAMGEGVNGPEAFSTPAFAKRITETQSAIPSVFVRLRDGAADVPQFRRSVNRLLADATPIPGAEEFAGFEVQVPSLDRSVVAVTARVVVTGLLVFGGIAALASLVGVTLALRRHFLATSLPNARALAAIGATRRQLLWSRWLAAIPFTLVGAATAVAVAVATAGIGPLGSLSEREPNPGWHPNVALLAVGAIVLLAAFAVVAAFASARQSEPVSSAPSVSTGIANRLAAAGAPTSVVIGSGMALGSSRGRGALSVRSALVASAIGIAGVAAVLVYAASLDRVVSTPARWGWTADAQVIDLNDEMLAGLRAHGDIDAIVPFEEFQVRVEGRNATGRVYEGPVENSWTLLDGRRPRGAGEVMLGDRLARTVGRGVGDRVAFRDSDGRAVTLAVVGIGTGPDLTDGQFGGGVVLTAPDAAQLQRTQPSRGALVTYADGADADQVSRRLSADMEITTPERPPDVDNLAQLGNLPVLLVAVLAVLTIAVLAHSVVVTARRRRRELDTLRAIGFLRHQARNVILVAAMVTVAIGLVVGVFAGIVVGGISWGFTARAAYVAKDLQLPMLQLLALGMVSFAIAVVVAAVPAWRITRDSIARGLREE